MKRVADKRRRGIALVTVMWLGAILAVMAMGLAYSTSLTVRTTGNWTDTVQAYYTAVSGLEVALGQIDAEETGVSELLPEGLLVDSDEFSQNPQEDRYRFITRVFDNCGKLDINTATVEQLALLPGLDEEIAAAIIEYRSSLTNEAGETSESQYDGFYQQQTPPYLASHLPFNTVDELLMVAGMTPELLYGAADYRLHLSAAERFRVEVANQFAPPAPENVPLIDMLTVGARVRDIASDAEPRLEFTTANLDALRQRAEALGVLEPFETAARTAGSDAPSDWDVLWQAAGNSLETMAVLADLCKLGEGSGEGGDGDGGDGGGDGGGGGGGTGFIIPGFGGGGRGGRGDGRDGFGGGGRGGRGDGRGGFGDGRGGGRGDGRGGGRGDGRGGGRGGRGSGRGGGGGGGGGPRSPGSERSDRGGYGPTLIAYQPRWTVRLAQLGGSAPQQTTQDGSQELEILEGQINLNTVSETVLQVFLTGLDPEMDLTNVVSAILAYRDSQPFRSRGDLLMAIGQQGTAASAELRQIFNALVDHVTVVSDSYDVESFGITRDGLIATQIRATVDRTTGRSVIVRFRQSR